jgi:uncharacterized membrane protein
MRKHFVTGMVILLPVVLTILIIVFLVDLLTGPFIAWLETTLAHQEWAQGFLALPGAKTFLHYGGQVLILIALFFMTVLLGMVGRWFFFKSFLRLGDMILARIPFVNKVYKTSQDIIRTIFADKSKSFKQVVMVPFPEKGVYSMGLVSGDAPPACKASAKVDLVSVFVPTTPNPTSGYLVMYPREACIFLDMKVEDAVKFIISCGVIHEGTSEILQPQKQPELKPDLS